MALPLTINGATFEYPEDFDEGWGINATGWAQAVTNGMLQMQGGSFPLTADVNFGPNFGLLSKYFETRTANPATVGTVRLASADAGVAWRNNANSGNLVLTTDSSDQLLYNGNPIATGSGAVTSITGTANQVIASSPTGAVTLSLPQSIATSSSPTFTGLTLTAFSGAVSASAGVLSAGTLSVANGGSGDTSHTAYAVLTGGTTSTNPVQSIATVGSAGQVLTSNGAGALPSFQNTTGSGTVNSGTANQLGYYATSSATISGLTAITANRGLISDANGLPIAAATTATEIGFVNGVTSAIQTQINATATVANAALPKTGGTMTGAIAMGANKITGLTDGTAATDAAAFGQLKYFQAVQTTGTTVSTTTSNTFTSTVITTSITPSDSSHRVKVTVTTSWDYVGTTGLGHATIERGTTNLGGSDGFSTIGAAGVSQNNQTLCMSYIDSPATTSSTSYTVYIRSEDNATQTRVGRSGTGTWVIILEEIA